MSVSVLAGTSDPESLAHQPTLGWFNPNALSFCQSFSAMLMKAPEAREYPEIAALGFWLREANLRLLRQASEARTGIARRPVGLAIHFTPSNVHTMFIYSWVCSLLAGNNNVLRLSSQESVVSQLLIGYVAELFEQPEYADLARRNLFVSFPRESSAGQALSLEADARVIWGGDESVRTIRGWPCKPRCRDVTFADRYSATVINGDALTPENVPQLAERLWRDLQPYHQMACSSPRVFFWMGAKTRRADLWCSLARLAGQEMSEQSRTMDHLVTEQWLQARGYSAGGPECTGPLCILPVEAITPEIIDAHPGQRLCYLVNLDHPGQLSQLDDRCQTLAYWGLEATDLDDWTVSHCPEAIDRIVPAGQALVFSTVWDGMDLLDQLSRLVVVR